MEYRIFNRPKLSRNKYGKVEKVSVVGGTSYFSNGSISSTSNTGSEIYDDFVGSTSTVDGDHGLVPAPKSNVNEIQGTLNDNVKFLKGNGAWTDIPISRYTEENTNNDGIDFNGVLNVTDTLTTQTLNVTGAAHFWELIIDKVKSTGGNLLLSPANFIVDYIGNDINYVVDSSESPFTEFFYNASAHTGIDGLQELFVSANISALTATRIYMKNDDGDVQTQNYFSVGDMVRCKTFNLELGQNKDYWTIVLKTGTEDYNDESCNYIDVFKSFTDGINVYPLGTEISDDSLQSSTDYAISAFTFGYGTLEIEVGDNIITLGHLWDSDRQSAILLSSCNPMDTELSAPAIAQYQGINEFSQLSPFRTNSLAANGNEFTGKFLVDYNGNYVDINERINIFSNDITTGLETVGIHLDGEDSTIKLVGSVEIKQNNNGTTDNLSVFDEDNIVRVQISPDEIPPKSQIDTNINPTTNNSFSYLNSYQAPNGSVVVRHTYQEFIFSWKHRYQYYLDNAYFTFNSFTYLGRFTAGNKITVDDINFTINSKAYFNSIYVSDRGTNQQGIDSIILRLEKLVSATWTTVETYNITNTANVLLTDEYVTISYDQALLDNYQFSSDGIYRLAVDVVYNVYATITFSSEQSSAEYKFDYSFNGTCKVVQPSGQMTRIGANGILFNTNYAGQYFYSGNDGIELKWGDVGVSLDSTVGYSRFKKIYTVTQSGTINNFFEFSIPIDTDVLFIEGDYVKLITISNANISEGKEIIVIGNSTTEYNSANLHNDYVSWQEIQDGAFVTVTHYLQKTRRKFIYHNSEWWEI